MNSDGKIPVPPLQEMRWTKLSSAYTAENPTHTSQVATHLALIR